MQPTPRINSPILFPSLMLYKIDDPKRVFQYEFRCTDNSWIQPFFNRYVNGPLLLRLPSRLAPNVITLTGHLAAWGAFALVLLCPVNDCESRWRAIVLMLYSLLLALYCICDSLDGMHARRINAATPLGDYYDHWLDCFAGFTIPIGFLTAVHAPPLAFALLSLCFAFGWTANNLERRQSNVLVLPKLGAMEANFIVIGLCLAEACASWSGASLFAPAGALLWGAVLIGAAGFLSAGYNALAAMSAQRIRVLYFFCALIPLAAWSLNAAAADDSRWFTGLLLICPLSAQYNGGILRNLLIGSADRAVDFIAIGAASSLIIVQQLFPVSQRTLWETTLLTLLAAWSCFGCIAQFAHTTTFCRKHLGIRALTLADAERTEQ